MTADEPMSTPDGGLREAVEAQARLWEQSESWAIHRHVVVQRLRALLAAHPEPVPTTDSGERIPHDDRLITCPECRSTFEAEDGSVVHMLVAPDSAAPCGRTGAHGPHDMPCDSGCQPDWHRDSCAIYGKCPGVAPDSAADATVGEREGRICEHDGCCNYRLCAHPKCCGYYVQSPATPPADDASRAPVSGGLDEGEREALRANDYTPPMGRIRDEYVEMRRQHYGFADLYAAEFDRALAARDAAWIERLAAVERERDGWRGIAQRREKLHDSVAELGTRLAAAEAERDTARREAGAKALRDAADDRSLRLSGHSGISINRLRARADALTSDDGRGA